MKTELEPEYKRNQGHGTGTETCYTVEARHCYPDAIVIAGQIFDIRWKRAHFEESPVGVPSGPAYIHRHAKEHGMLSYQAAQALRWWIHAQGESTGTGCVCLETRLVKHQIKWSYSIEAMSAHDLVTGDDRSNIMPDWGAQPQQPTKP